VKHVTFDAGSVRGTGEAAVGALRRLLARKAAEMIRHDSDAAEVAMEMGLVDRRWLENPERAPITIVPPSEVIERFLERAVETRPSRLSTLGLGAAQLLAGRLATPPSGKPEWMTVVFTDLEGFTSFTDREGDEAALRLLRDHHRDAGPIVRREGGRIVKHIGDGLLCTFGDPQGGLRAAVNLLDAAPEPLRLRAGVHMGEAITAADDVIGHVVNVTARVAETARGGHAVASLETVEAAGPTAGVVVGKAKTRKLKGISERIALVDISRDPQTRVALTAGS
jgi:adenylate cyclase